MTKTREQTSRELLAEIEEGKKKIRQLENREKILRQKLSREERRTRSHRLIVRGAVFESIVPEAKNMTDEEAAVLLRFALTSKPVQDFLRKRAEGLISAQGIASHAPILAAAPRTGDATLPLRRLRVYPFVYLPKADALLRKPSTFNKSEYLIHPIYPIWGGDTIAIYHCSIKIVSRGKGKSAVAAAAYRSGEKLVNEWDGMTHDYTKKGGVVHSEIMLPAHAPPKFSDRSILWNSVELNEKSGNAQFAREVEIALPVELSREEQLRLVRGYCSSQFVSKGMCVDFSIHDTGDGNPHAHVLLTMRPLDGQGGWAAKSKKEYVLDAKGERVKLPSGRYKTRKVDLVDWNSQQNAETWRGVDKNYW